MEREREKKKEQIGVVGESVKASVVFQSLKTGILHMWTCAGELVHIYSETAAASSCVFLIVGAFDYCKFCQVICKIK